MTIKILFWLLLMFFSNVNSSLLTLFGKTHFYEINLQQNVPNRKPGTQSFSQYINGNDKCLPTHDARLFDNLENMFGLKSEPLIYSDNEFTLFFMIRIEFKSHINEHTLDVRGYQVQIDFENERSCFQIFQVREQLDNALSTHYVVKVKDPIKLSMNRKEFTFYFGQVTVKPIIGCHKDSLVGCGVPNFDFQSVQVGIRDTSKNESLSASRLTNFDTNLCDGHLLNQSCIKRYRSSSYFIVMHPMPKQFDRVIASTNTLIKYRRFKDRNDSDIDMEDFIMKPQIVSTHDQALDNNLVLKLIRIEENFNLFYTSLLKDSNSNNTCRDENRQCSCQTDFRLPSKCSECYSLKTTDEPIILVVPAESKSSLECNRNSRYENYEFNQIQLEIKFQNKLTTSQVSNDNLPRICMRTNRTTSGFTHIEIMFRDSFGIAQSILANEKFMLKLHKYEYESEPGQHISKAVVAKKIVITESLLIGEFVPSNSIHIDWLLPGRYMLELRPHNNALCKHGQCISESINKKNQYECVKCAFKLVTRFIILGEKTTEKMKKPKTIEFVLKPNGSVWFETDRLKDFACAIEDQANTFEYNLRVSANDASLVGSKTKLIELKSQSAYSGLLPYEFDLNQLKLYHDGLSDQDFLNSNQFYQHYTWLLIMLLIILLLFFIIMAFMIKQLGLKFTKQSRLVVFYLSIFVDKDTQKEMKEIAQLYQKLIMKYFSNITIEIVDYTIKSTERKSLIENCDLIVYFAFAEQELNKQIQIGQNWFHVDFHRIHFVEKYKAKCLDLLFDMTSGTNKKPDDTLPSDQYLLLEINKSETEKFKCIRLPSENSRFISFVTDKAGFIEAWKTSQQGYICFVKFKSYLKTLSISLILFKLSTCLNMKLRRCDLLKKLSKCTRLSSQNENLVWPSFTIQQQQQQASDKIMITPKHVPGYLF